MSLKAVVDRAIMVVMEEAEEMADKPPPLCLEAVQDLVTMAAVEVEAQAIQVVVAADPSHQQSMESVQPSAPMYRTAKRY